LLEIETADIVVGESEVGLSMNPLEFIERRSYLDGIFILPFF
jgi:hypothetical protein